MDPARSRQAGIHGDFLAQTVPGREGTTGKKPGPRPAHVAGVKAKLMGTNTKTLAGKHAVVTGGARGIGAAITHALLAHGARVTMLGRSPAGRVNFKIDQNHG